MGLGPKCRGTMEKPVRNPKPWTQLPENPLRGWLMPQYLPSTISEFSQIRSNPDFAYIDKTGLIADMVGQPDLPYLFMSRPRRFGKTMLISTLEALFRGQRALFEGTWIGDADHWDWSQKPYPVIRLDMSHYNVPQTEPVSNMTGRMRVMLQEQYEKFDLSPPEADVPPDSSLSHLIGTLHRTREQNVVVLIDEYDTPVTENLDKPDILESMLELMRSFYGVLKRQASHIRLTFMTGVTRLSLTGLFSGANHLRDLSFSIVGSTLLGYTQDELHHHAALRDSVAQGARNLGCSPEDLLQALEQHFNGYRFSREGEPVYNPFSLNNCLSDLQGNEAKLWGLDNLPNFWARTGTPAVLLKFFKGHSGFLSPGILPDTRVGLIERTNFNVQSPHPTVLLYQCGYLTRKRVRDPQTGDWHDGLEFPNREVEISYRESFLEWYNGLAKDWSASTPRGLQLHTQLREAIHSHSAVEMHNVFNAYMSAFSYVLYPPIGNERDMTPGRRTSDYEKFYQHFLYGTCLLLADNVQAEVETQRGRIDLVVELSDHILLFELKVNSSPVHALRQILLGNYPSFYQTDLKPVSCLGLNFDTRRRRLAGCVQWDLGRFALKTGRWDNEPMDTALEELEQWPDDQRRAYIGNYPLVLDDAGGRESAKGFRSDVVQTRDTPGGPAASVNDADVHP